MCWGSTGRDAYEFMLENQTAQRPPSLSTDSDWLRLIFVNIFACMFAHDTSLFHTQLVFSQNTQAKCAFVRNNFSIFWHTHTHIHLTSAFPQVNYFKEMISSIIAVCIFLFVWVCGSGLWVCYMCLYCVYNTCVYVCVQTKYEFHFVVGYFFTSALSCHTWTEFLKNGHYIL